MFRLALFVALFALAVGCKKKPADPVDPGASNTPGTPPAPTGFASVPKLQPRAKFKLPEPRGYQVGRVAALSANGNVLAIGTGNVGVTGCRIYDLSGEPKEIGTVKSCSAFALSPNGKRLMVSTSDERRVLDIATNEVILKLPVGDETYFLDDETVLVGSQWELDFSKATPVKFTRWSLATMASTGSFEVPDGRFVPQLVSGGKELWLFPVTNGFEVSCYEAATGKLARTIRPELGDRKQAYTDSGEFVSVNGRASVFGSNTDQMRFYDATNGKVLLALSQNFSATKSGFVRDSIYVASISKPDQFGLSNGDLALLDVPSARPVAVLPKLAEKTDDRFVLASANGNVLVDTSKEGDVAVYDISKIK